MLFWHRQIFTIRFTQDARRKETHQRVCMLLDDFDSLFFDDFLPLKGMENDN